METKNQLMNTVNVKEEFNMNKMSNEELLKKIMEDLTYYKTKDGLYVTIEYKNRKINVPARGEEYRKYIEKRYYDETHRIIRKSLIYGMLDVVESEKEDEGNLKILYDKRYAAEHDVILVNVADKNLRYVEITNCGYDISESDDLIFRGDPNLKPMEVMPIEEASDIQGNRRLLDALDKYFNLNADDMFLLKIWLVAAANPKIDTPLLYFLGSAGTGKSSMQRIIGDLIDPSIQDIQNWDDIGINDLAVLLDSPYLISFDNISKITGKKSDFLCQCVTGGEKAKRKLFTDSEIVRYKLKTRVTLSSVSNCINREDLQTRTFFMDVPKIEGRKRILEGRLFDQYKQEASRLRGEIFCTLVFAMEKFPEWEKTHAAYHRMAGFELFGSCIASIIDEKTGYERFMRIIREKHVVSETKDRDEKNSILGMLEIIDKEYDGIYEGGMRTLYDITYDWLIDSPDSSYHVETCIPYDKFGRIIHKREPLLCSLGYEIVFSRDSKANTSKLSIRKITESDEKIDEDDKNM